MFGEDVNGSSSAINIGCLDILAEWVETLHGQGELIDALSRLVAVTHAQAAFIQRQQDGRISLKNIATADPGARKKMGAKHPSYLRDMLGDQLSDMRVGATISLKDVYESGRMSRDRQITLRTELSAHMIRDIVAIRLSDYTTHSEYLELHFHTELPDSDRELLAIMGPTLSKTWKARLPGTVERSLSHAKMRPDPNRHAKTAKILEVSNPYGLSRSEFRVCMLVREGLLVKSIAHKLGVMEPTVRAHLRSIYQKTRISCHVELLHRLTTEFQTVSEPQPATAPPKAPQGRLHLN